MLSERSAGDDCLSEFVDTHLEMQDPDLQRCLGKRSTKAKQRRKQSACQRYTEVQTDGMKHPSRSMRTTSFSFSYFIRGLLVDSSPSSKSKAKRTQPSLVQSDLSNRHHKSSRERKTNSDHSSSTSHPLTFKARCFERCMRGSLCIRRLKTLEFEDGLGLSS